MSVFVLDFGDTGDHRMEVLQPFSFNGVVVKHTETMHLDAAAKAPAVLAILRAAGDKS